MARDYCTLESVKRLLRTATQKVKTSESYKDLNYNSGNLGDGRLSGVTFEDSYVGSERFEAEFSDSTSFEVVGEEIGFLGNGTVGATFSCAQFTIPSSMWSGVAQTTDVFYFTSDSNISVDDAEGFIDDASNYITNRLGVVFGDSTNIPWEIDYSIEIPEGLNYAAIRLTAYEIFSAILAGQEIDQESPVYEWYKLAEKAIDAFIKWWVEEGSTGAPLWRSRDVRFKEIGVGGTPVDESLTDVTVDVEDGVTYVRN